MVCMVCRKADPSLAQARGLLATAFGLSTAMSAERSCGNASGALYIARHSHCPGEQWHDLVARLPQPPTHGELHFVNIGANKGYNLVAFNQRYSTAQPVSFRRWHQLLMRNDSYTPMCQAQCCGVCNTCSARDRGPSSPRDHAPTVRMHALEAAPVNAAILRRAVRVSGLPATVHAIGVSDSAAPLFASADTVPGYETSSVSLTRGTPIRTTTGDNFFRTAGIAHAYMVTIDTEGWDGRVLAGMRRVLEAKRVDLLEFEYSVHWRKHGQAFSLKATLDWLLQAGYRCFWQGWAFNGLLAPASGPCWQDEFAALHPMSWGNLICSHRPDVLDVLKQKSLGPERGPPG